MALYGRYYEKIDCFPLLASVLSSSKKKSDQKTLHRSKIKKIFFHPAANIILRERIEPNSSGTQKKAFNETQIRRNQNFIKIQNDELEVKPYPKRKSNKKQNFV